MKNGQVIVFTSSGGEIPEMTSLMTSSLRNSIWFFIFHQGSILWSIIKIGEELVEFIVFTRMSTDRHYDYMRYHKLRFIKDTGPYFQRFMMSYRGPIVSTRVFLESIYHKYQLKFYPFIRSRSRTGSTLIRWTYVIRFLIYCFS